MIAWRALQTGSGAGAWNMAADGAILAEVERGSAPPTLRIYAWDPPAISLGFHQPDPAPDASARIAAAGWTWVRRPTGGRAVFHGSRHAELTYAVVAGLGEAGLPAAPPDAYRRIHQAIADALAGLGVRAELAARRRAAERPTSRLACFAASVPGEVTVGGRKLVGSAQRRARRALLQHGSIPLAGGQTELARVWPGSLDPGCATTVSAAAGRDVTFDELAASLLAAFARAFGPLEPGEPSPAELARIDAIAAAARLTPSFGADDTDDRSRGISRFPIREVSPR